MNKNKLRRIIQWAVLCLSLSACGYIHDDLPPCPEDETGLSLAFRYDYNLQRADMFPDHVGSVTVYMLDQQGSLLAKRTESGEALSAADYRMHWDLEPGTYQYVVWAGQKPFDEMWQTAGAKFRLSEPAAGDSVSALSLTLDHQADGQVAHGVLPLDTVWHGMSLHLVEVVSGKQTLDTVSLVRDTKQINLVLHNLDNPEEVHIADFDIRITDRNARLLWNNEVDESEPLVYTPYAAWDTENFAHADLMVSRLIDHAPEVSHRDAVLSVVNRKTGVEVIRVNLPELLAELRTSSELYRYTPQEFLDRGYDYRLAFFLKGDSWAYVNIEIAVLSWTKRIQYEDIQL